VTVRPSDTRQGNGVTRPRPDRWWRRWPHLLGWTAAIWSLVYGFLGAYWALGGAGFPFGSGYDPGARLSVLADARPETTGWAIAVVGALGVVAAIALARGAGRGASRTLLIAVAWVFAVTLALVITDFRILVLVAYTPILLLGAPFGWLTELRIAEAITWPLVNQGVCMAGGVLWAATAVSYQRRTRGACAHCGRDDAEPSWSTREAAARWGKPAVAVAVLVPVVYAVTRIAWALGYPLGITEAFFRQGVATGLWLRGAALATLALAGAALTLGLAQRWSEVFPGWVPILGGRRVPRKLVIVPAVSVSIIVTTAGLMFVRAAIAGDFTLGTHAVTWTENWGALWPELLWPVWGVALAGATLAYHLRTRGRCAYCGRV
jgi:hypothetical protein